MKLLLASQSPRRRQLLAQLGLPLECISLDVDEHVPAGTPADGMAELLACRKAAACPDDMILDDTVVVAADTVVVLDGQPLGKPVSRQQAIDMLRALSGRHHSVYTGVCLRSRSRSVHFSERTDVFFRPLADSEILHYVDTCRPFDKAGAYGIQEWIGMIGISRIEGCYYNVMGLPLAALWQHLRTLS
jgi:septum formation protein